MDTALSMAIASVSHATRCCYVNQFVEFVKFLHSKFDHSDLFQIQNKHVIIYLAHLFSKKYAPSTMVVKLFLLFT